MAVHIPSSLLFFLLVFTGLIRSASGNKQDYYEWKGNRRAVVIEDRKPFSKNPDLTWSRGWMCGWTPHGLCFSPDHKEDIHDFYVIPFKNIRRDVYCDQVPNLNVRGFGINSVILAKFRAAVDKKQYWQAVVNRYSKNGRRQVISLVARTVFHSLGVNQIEESFQPNQVWLQGAHDACKHFKTECTSRESCVPRILSNRVWPGEYKCVCKSGWKQIRGRGCVDFDECTKFPCGAYQVCVNTLGSYSCQCKMGYTGEKCNVDIDECQMKPCPANSMCENIPGSFNCTCLPGYSGKGCAESSELSSESKGDPIVTFKVIKQHSEKEILIPRKKPTIVVRKAVYSKDPGHKEMAIMGSLMFFFSVVGMCLYRIQKKKRAKETKVKKEQNNQELEVTGTFPSSQVLVDEETALSSQELADDEFIQDSRSLENKAIPSRQSVGNKGDVPNGDAIENEETMSSSQTLIDGKATGKSQTLETKTFPSSQSLLAKGAIPSQDAIKNRQTLSSSQALVDGQVIPSSQFLVGTIPTTCSYLVGNREISLSSQGLETVENGLSVKKCTASSSQPLDKENVLGNGSSAVKMDGARSSQSLDNEVVLNSESLKKDVVPSSHDQPMVNKEVVLCQQSRALNLKEVVLSQHSLNKDVVLSSSSVDKDIASCNQVMDTQTTPSSEALERENICDDKEVADRNVSGQSDA